MHQYVSYLLGILMFLTAVFLILLIMIQRGRGGGLAGAFGGMGGQSAFGTKAGDLFTRVTMGVATFWILLCIAAIALLNSRQSVFGTASGKSAFGATSTQNGEEKGAAKAPGGAAAGEGEPAASTGGSDSGANASTSGGGDAGKKDR